MSPTSTPSGCLDAASVRAKLDLGFELIYYKATRSTIAGWVIDNYAVHGATVNAMSARGEISIYPARAGSAIVRTARRAGR